MHKITIPPVVRSHCTRAKSTSDRDRSVVKYPEGRYDNKLLLASLTPCSIEWLSVALRVHKLGDFSVSQILVLFTSFARCPPPSPPSNLSPYALSALVYATTVMDCIHLITGHGAATKRWLVLGETGPCLSTREAYSSSTTRGSGCTGPPTPTTRSPSTSSANESTTRPPRRTNPADSPRDDSVILGGKERKKSW